MFLILDRMHPPLIRSSVLLITVSSRSIMSVLNCGLVHTFILWTMSLVLLHCAATATAIMTAIITII